MAKYEESTYNNKIGYFTDEELLEFKHMTDEDFTNYLRSFNNMTNKCPPVKYKTVPCFYCIQCMRNSRSLVKEKKIK